MKYLVLGATGTVGSQVARELLERGHQVRVLTRDPAKAAVLGAGVEIVKGDLLDPITLKTLFTGVDGAFLLNGVSITESQEGLMALTAAKVAGLKKIVYMSVQHADRAPHLPHFGSKVGIEFAIKHSGIPYTILRPSNFYQNDYWFKDVVLQYGVYPQPFGTRARRTTSSDRARSPHPRPPRSGASRSAGRSPSAAMILKPGRRSRSPTSRHP